MIAEMGPGERRDMEERAMETGDGTRGVDRRGERGERSVREREERIFGDYGEGRMGMGGGWGDRDACMGRWLGDG